MLQTHIQNQHTHTKLYLVATIALKKKLTKKIKLEERPIGLRSRKKSVYDTMTANIL